MLNSMFCFVFNVMEQLIVLMLDLVLQSSALVVGHVVAIDVTGVVAVLVNVMSEVLIVCMFVIDVMMLNSMFCFVFDVMEQFIVLMLNFVLQSSALVVGHVVAIDVARVVAVLVDVMSEVFIVCMIVVDVMMLNSMLNLVLNVMEQLIVLMLDLVL